MGARTRIGGRDLTVWKARALAEAPEPAPDSPENTDRLILLAAEGWVELLEVQAPGGRRMAAAEYLRGAGRWLSRG